MTAYKEAMDNQLPMPSYLQAADTHNLGNGNDSYLVEDVAEFVTEDIPQFITLSLLSTANNIYNIPASVGNLFGADIEAAELDDWVAGIDTDLSQYYEDHKTGVDLVGLVASSIIPGTAGVKGLKAGQTMLTSSLNSGKIGGNLASSLKLLVPNQQLHLKEAMKTVLTNGSVVSLANINAKRALAAGAGQNFLEGIAFEVAVAATMNESPIFENHDFWDFASNIAVGAALNVGIGGIIDATQISSSLKKASNEAAVKARPWTFIKEHQAATPTESKIALDYDQLIAIPEVPKDLPLDRQAFLQNSAVDKATRINNRIRANFGKLAAGDEVAASVLHAKLKGIDVLDQQGAVIGLKEIARLNTTTRMETTLKNWTARAEAGTLGLKEVEKLTSGELNIGYVRTWGERAGRVTADDVTPLYLVDTLAKGQTIKVMRSGVEAGKKKYAFSADFNRYKEGAARWNLNDADPMTVSARYSWAAVNGKLSPTKGKPVRVQANDIPMLEQLLKLDEKQLRHVTIEGADWDGNAATLLDFIGRQKVTTAVRLAKNRPELTQEQIAAMVNVRSSMLDGMVRKSPVGEYSAADILAYQSYAEEYTKEMISKGVRKEKQGTANILNVPQHLKLAYDAEGFKGLDTFTAENMKLIKEQQVLYAQGMNNASAAILGEFYEELAEVSSQQIVNKAVPTGAGGGAVTAASSNYGSLAAQYEFTGSVTSRAIAKRQSEAADVLNPYLSALRQNREAAVEWSVLNSNLRNIEGHYGLAADGESLAPIELIDWERKVKAAEIAGRRRPRKPKLPEHMPERITINNKETLDLAKAHIEVNGINVDQLGMVRTAEGKRYTRDSRAFYPIPVDPTKKPFFAIVIDETVTSGNASTSLYADSAEELQRMILNAKTNPHYTVLTKKDAENYYKSIGQYEFDKTIHNTYMNNDLQRRGASASHVVPTDSGMVIDEVFDWHMKRQAGIVREGVSAKYAVQFEELRLLGEEATNVSASKFSSLLEYASAANKNPYADYIKTALAIRKTADYPFWMEANRLADAAVSRVINGAKDIIKSAKGPDDLDKINEMLTKAGYKHAGYNEEMAIFANANVDRTQLTKTVQRSNSVLATVTLRWDAINAVNNAVSANILLSAEAKSVLRAIKRGDDNAVGALKELAHIKVPGRQEDLFSAQKLIANAMKAFNRNSDEMAFFKQHGFTTTLSDQYRAALDDVTYKAGDEAIGTWASRINNMPNRLKQAGDLGELITGNKLAEEFNRFVAAHTMKQLTDVAVAAGKMTDKEALAYINTFVNRTQGNYLAAQRPAAFQGAIGQAIGLFQTYQFNLIQQMLRYVGEGEAKDVMTLMGMQATIHGMNGLPAFNAVNTHIIGNASGNKEHTDLYDTVYGTAGKEAGDWLMYGLGSNFLGLIDPDLKLNLYTRGDVNPRHWTILPTNPADVPFVAATTKVVNNVFSTLDNLKNGGDIKTTLLNGLEHNGISRPLQGLAVALKGVGEDNVSFSTTNKGNVVYANDLISWANLGRIAGAKPMDEAVTIDALYRFKAYTLKDQNKRTKLGEAIRTKVIGGERLEQEEFNDFLQKYVEYGGRQKEFNSWMMRLYKDANLSATNKIASSLNSPFAQKMQEIMGGELLQDFYPD